MNSGISQPAVHSLVAEYLEGGVSRRQFVKGALALGLGMTTIGGLLAACTSASNGQSATPKQGGTLKEGYDLDFSRLDPINTNWYDPAFYAVYESLVTNDAQGNYVPQIASSWKVASDGLSVTFKPNPMMTSDNLTANPRAAMTITLTTSAKQGEYYVQIDAVQGCATTNTYIIVDVL